MMGSGLVVELETVQNGGDPSKGKTVADKIPFER